MEPVPELSLVVPMFDEDAVIDTFLSRVIPILETTVGSFEIVCVNDGSRDATLQHLISANARDPRVKIIDLSRNFGKELALTAGLDFACGRAVIPLDADLQDPPELIPQMVEKWREGYDVVLAHRTDRSADSVGKRVTASWFYSISNKLSEVPIPKNVGDFRLMDRRVIDALAQLPERARFMKGLFAWLGFRQTAIHYVRPPRAAGTTKWHPMQLWRLALEGFVSFTTLPLKVWTYVGGLCALLSLGYGAFIVIKTAVLGVDVPGYASVVTFVLFFSGLNLLGLGILGEYVARIFIEVKRRPMYLVRSAIGFEQASVDAATDRRRDAGRVPH